MGEDSAQTGHAEAQAMLDAFASVGAIRFNVTWTTRAGEKRWYKRSVSMADLADRMPAMLDTTAKQEINVIVRPYGGPNITFVQLDDIKADNLARLAPAVFLILETSPANFQAWVAIPEAEDRDFMRRLRQSTGADPTASGATRVAGSLNFKDKYAPDFPRVAIHQVNPGRMTSVAELDRLGLVAAPEAAQPLRITPAPARTTSTGGRKWPSYTRCVDGAPLNSEETGPDISRADFVFCMTAITWGWSVHQTAERLMEESTKAQTNGERYASLTARNAALAVERRRDQPRRHRVAAAPEQS